ncbi:AlbA family DNA-binding domain-containing protein [Oceanidesulfovibrio indonesiensis]|nr:ATP-binding protein [Oceanidesulfovibrio indonesiensis]
MERSCNKAAVLDVVKRDMDYAVYAHGAVLTTPGGAPVASPKLRLLEHIVRDVTTAAPEELTALDFFHCERDVVETDTRTAEARFLHALSVDPVAARRFPGLGASAAPVNISLDTLDPDLPPMLFLYGGLSEALGRATSYLMENGHESALRDFSHFSAVVLQAFRDMPAYRRSPILILAERHGGGALLPFLLLTGRLSESEYANAVLSLEWYHYDGATASQRFRSLRDEARQAREYAEVCRAASREESAGSRVQELIARGECHHVEFKSTLRLNLHSGKNDPNISHASLKTIAAFLNSSGGTLLIGVRDDGSIEGIETDGFPNEDRFGLHLWQLVESTLGGCACPFVSSRYESLDGRVVCSVSCSESPRPVFLQSRKGDEEFWVRVGPSSRQLGVREALDYIKLRFRQD